MARNGGGVELAGGGHVHGSSVLGLGYGITTGENKLMRSYVVEQQTAGSFLDKGLKFPSMLISVLER